tara:strand:+ start:70 stop:510 length:441 start_codon:yes stop_codon:yes gene_type:complete
MKTGYLNRNSGNGGMLIPVEHLIGAKTLKAVEDSGKVFTLDAAGGAYSITLPTALEVGINYKLIIDENTPTGAITIAAGSAILFGKIAESEVDTSDDNPGSSGATGVSNLIFGTSAEQGDYVEIVCDGVKWYFYGNTAKDGAVTTS